MKGLVVIPLLGLITLVSNGAPVVGVSADAVTVPLSAVTVPLAAVTVSAASITRQSDSCAQYQELVESVRKTDADETSRLAAMEQIIYQDDIFYLFFKPGEDRNIHVRVAAIQKLAEVDVLKALGKKMNVPEVSKAIEERLAAVYAASSDRESPEDSAVVAQYTQRLKARMR